jgi:hypothetical protein
MSHCRAQAAEWPSAATGRASEPASGGLSRPACHCTRWLSSRIRPWPRQREGQARPSGRRRPRGARQPRPRSRPGHPRAPPRTLRAGSRPTATTTSEQGLGGAGAMAGRMAMMSPSRESLRREILRWMAKTWAADSGPGLRTRPDSRAANQGLTRSSGSAAPANPLGFGSAGAEESCGAPRQAVSITPPEVAGHPSIARHDQGLPGPGAANHEASPALRRTRGPREVAWPLRRGAAKKSSGGS